MFRFLYPDAPSLTPREIAQSFRWLGWIGLGLQAFMGFIPLLVVLTNVLTRPERSISGPSFGLLLACACLVILCFSTYWCFRYTQLANRLEVRELRPAKAQVIQQVKWGLVANVGIMVLAVCIALVRVGELTFKMLTLPQGGTIIMPNSLGTTVASPGTLITPSNMIAIQAMVNAIAAGLVGTIVALLLLYQVGQHRNAND